MIVLVINCGSSSFKFHLFQMPGEKQLAEGLAEKSGSGDTHFSFESAGRAFIKSWKGFSYTISLEAVIHAFIDPPDNCLPSLRAVDVVGHRLIHGGEGRSECAGITPSLVAEMERSVDLAPLHYPANIGGIKAVSQLMPEVPQAGVFDTAFHHTLPPKAFLYGIPLRWYQQHQIRRYGFHGTSHRYASRRVCEITGLPSEKSRIVTCHLGNGASVAAVKNGRSIDTSMGMTPVEGLLMGSRSGDIDAGLLLYLQQHFNLSANDLQQLVNKEGGLLGLSGISGDYRAVEKAARNGNAAAHTALMVYYYRIKKYIGAYTAAMGGIDALVFTGGIGENSMETREKVCREMEFFGIRLSEKRNEQVNGTEGIIHHRQSKVKVAIVPAREALMIARDVAAWLRRGAGNE